MRGARLEALPVRPGHGGRVWLYRAGRRPPGGPHRHHEIELNLVLGGTATYDVDGCPVELVGGDGLLLWPRHSHALVDPSADFAMWIVVVSPELLRRMCTTPASAALADPVGPVRPLHWKPGAATTDWVDGLLHRLTGPGDPALHAAGLCHVLLAAFTGARDADPAVGAPRYAQEARRLLETGAVDWTVPRLARAVGASASSLNRSFRRAYGVSVVGYRHRAQIARACALYGAGGSMTLHDAASLAGFGSYSQFHRVVTSVHGCSPREHARRLSASTSKGPS